MKKLLIMVLLNVFSDAVGIDPNLMYGLGSVQNVPIEYNPIIGLSFLKFGVIKSWLESSSKDAVVNVTYLLFQPEGTSVEGIKISYLTPEHIGRLLRIIAEHEKDLEHLKQAMVKYLTTLSEFKDASAIPADVDKLLDLIVHALLYVDATTKYPKYSVQALLLSYLCAISQSRNDIQSYFQGFLNDPILYYLLL